MTRSKLGTMTVDELVERFAQIAIEQDHALRYDDYARFNRLYGQMDVVDNELRARGSDARLALLRLYEHPNWQVRLKAATRTLGVAPALARSALEAIASSRHYPYAGHAGMLISGLDDGSFKPT